MPDFRDIAGQRFGRLIAVERIARPAHCKKGTYWRCMCSCGGERIAMLSALTAGYAVSCGCRARECRDIFGQRFGRLVALKRLPRLPGGVKQDTKWLCRCDCGTEKPVGIGALTGGGTRSCGCIHREGTRTRHGMSNTRIYQIYNGAKRRATAKPGMAPYAKYAGRGITMDPHWLECFENFYADMGDPPPGMTLERIDNDGPYSKGNCRWATPKEQAANRRSTRLLDLNGKKQCIRAWAKETGKNEMTIITRIARGWSIEDAVLREPSSRPERIVELDGERRNIRQWSKATGINEETIRARLRYGWSIRDALTLPPQPCARPGQRHLDRAPSSLSRGEEIRAISPEYEAA